ncbi:transposase [Streptomyces parvus]|uniref:transposase n=1 Tax=Streptomyces parvus TaxID=66428 RepID=UPI00344D48D7
MLIDETHPLNPHTPTGTEAADRLKDLTEHIGATLVYAGIDATASPVLSGVRNAQLAGRASLIDCRALPGTTWPSPPGTLRARPLPPQTTAPYLTHLSPAHHLDGLHITTTGTPTTPHATELAEWAGEGVFARLNGVLRQLLREREGRDAEPTACVMDAQSVKSSIGVPVSGQHIHAGKKVVGRERSIVTGTLGLPLAVVVTEAGVQDSVAGTVQVAADHPGIRKVWGDGGYRQQLVEHAATLGIGIEVTARETRKGPQDTRLRNEASDENDLSQLDIRHSAEQRKRREATASCRAEASSAGCCGRPPPSVSPARWPSGSQLPTEGSWG